jgi:hypothetical protein
MFRTLALQGERVLIIQPTKHLLNETASRLRASYPDVSVVVMNEDTVGSGVSTDLQHLKDAASLWSDPANHWASFERLRYFHRRGDWTVFLDEPPQGHECIPLKAAITHHYLTDCLFTHPCGPKYSRLLVRDRRALRRLVRMLQLMMLLMPMLKSRIALSGTYALVRGRSSLSGLTREQTGLKSKYSGYNSRDPFRDSRQSTSLVLDLRESLVSPMEISGR